MTLGTFAQLPIEGTTYTYTSVYARLKSLAAIKVFGFTWNSTPWLGPLLARNHIQTISDRMCEDPQLRHLDINSDDAAILHLGRSLGLGMNVFLWLPNVRRSKQTGTTRCPDERFMRTWTNDIVLPAFGQILDVAAYAFMCQGYDAIMQATQAGWMDSPSLREGMPFHHQFPATSAQLGTFWNAILGNIGVHPELCQLGHMILFAFNAPDLPKFDGDDWYESPGEMLNSPEEVWKHEARMWDECMYAEQIATHTFNVQGRFCVRIADPHVVQARQNGSETRTVVVLKRSRVPSVTSPMTSPSAPRTKRSRAYLLEEDAMET